MTRGESEVKRARETAERECVPAAFVRYRYRVGHCCYPAGKIGPDQASCQEEKDSRGNFFSLDNGNGRTHHFRGG